MQMQASMKPIVVCLLSLGICAGGISCSTNTQDKPVSDANAKRWEKFQKTNKKDMEVGKSAYERRQAQLAAKKSGKAEPPSPATATTPAATTTPPATASK